jgi:hypothetical protein
VQEVSKAGNAGESVDCPILAAKRDAKLFFNADGELECVKRIEAKPVAHERLVVGNSVRIEYIGPQLVNNEPLQLRYQKDSLDNVASHPATIMPDSEIGYGV